MADTPKIRAFSETQMTSTGYDALLIHASWEAIQRSYMLLDQTKPLVTPTEGGSWIGAHLVDPHQLDGSNKKQ